MLWLSRTRPALRTVPAVTALLLFVGLLVLSVLDTPGGDLVTPILGWGVSALACVALFVGLRRRAVPPYRHPASWGPGVAGSPSLPGDEARP